MTLTPVYERLAVDLLISLLTTKVRRGVDRKTQHSAYKMGGLAPCATTAVIN